MSYHEGRSSFLDGSPEPGLSSVIKVRWKCSEVFRKNDRSSLQERDSIAGVRAKWSQVPTVVYGYRGVIVTRIVNSFGVVFSAEVRRPAFERRSRNKESNSPHKDSRHCHQINFSCRFQDGVSGFCRWDANVAVWSKPPGRFTCRHESRERWNWFKIHGG